jgi:adenylate cyclase
MREGRAQVVSVVAEAGTGKSRLIAELFARLGADGRLDGVVVRRAACSSLGEPTYGVFGALFRDAYRVEPGDSLHVAREKLVSGLRAMGARDEEAEAVAPVLSYVLGVEEAKPRDVEPEQLQRQIALAARTLLERRLSQAPLVLLIEDLHWADTASVDLLRGAADQLADRPLMILLTHRPEARPPMVARAEQTVLRLGPLSSSDTRAMVDGLFGEVGGDPLGQIGDIVVSRAGGNPLFVEEIVRMLVARGVLVREGERWTSPASCQEVDVPPTLQGLLLSRIDKLGAEERRLLQEAAVLGVDFDEPLLRAVAAAPPEALERLVASDLLQPAGRGREGARFRFTHALVHDVVYQNLLLARRTEMHERVARALERAAGPRPERLSDLEALGHHWSLSADKPRGARYLLAAGDWARGLYANEDAIRHYDRARRILAESPDSEADMLVARERLGDLLGLTGRRAEALAHYEAVRGAAEARSDGSATARLHRKIGGLHWDAGDRDRAGACFAAGLERLGGDGDGIERAHLFQELGRLAFRGGDNAAAIEWAEKALAEATGEPTPTGAGAAAGADAERAREAAAVRVHAYNTLGVALARTGRPAEAVEQIERSVALAEARELLQAACRGYTNLSVLYASLDPPRSIETCRRGLAMAKRVGDLGFQSRLYANLAVAYCALTDRCEAEGVEAAQAAVALDRRLGLIDHLAVPLIVLGQIEQCHGDHARAFACYEEALGLAEQVGEPQLLFPCYDGLATLYLDTGDVATAETYLAKAQAVCERAGVEPDALMVLPFLC